MARVTDSLRVDRPAEIRCSEAVALLLGQLRLGVSRHRDDGDPARRTIVSVLAEESGEQAAYAGSMATISSPNCVDPAAVAEVLAGVEPAPLRLVLFGSRARGDARPDSDIDLLVVMPQARLTPQERQLALRALRAALRPLALPVGVDLVVVGQEDARQLAGSRWHVVARALREGKELHGAG